MSNPFVSEHIMKIFCEDTQIRVHISLTFFLQKHWKFKPKSFLWFVSSFLSVAFVWEWRGFYVKEGCYMSDCFFLLRYFDYLNAIASQQAGLVVVWVARVNELINYTFFKDEKSFVLLWDDFVYIIVKDINKHVKWFILKIKTENANWNCLTRQKSN